MLSQPGLQALAGRELQSLLFSFMSQESSLKEDSNARPLTFEEKISRWEGWDESQWHPDWMKVYGRVVGWSAGGSVLGAAHALTTGRSVIPNALLFAGYTTIVSGAYFVSREALFGREVERFRQESLALGLPEAKARDYPWRWDVLCGGISGAIFGSLVGQNRKMVALGSGLFAVAALALRAGSAASSDYILPRILPAEQVQMERIRRRQVLTEKEVHDLEEQEEQIRQSTKPWLFSKLPDWSPVQAYTKSDKQKIEEDKEYEKWLESEVEATRVSVGIKRRLQQLEMEHEAKKQGQLNSISPPSLDSTSTRQDQHEPFTQSIDSLKVKEEEH